MSPVVTYGVDFTCAPRRAKPITVAAGILSEGELRLSSMEKLETFQAFEQMLARPGPWVGGFDLPFSLPAELVRDLKWPGTWQALVAHCAAMTRQELRNALDAYRATRPVGAKYAHRMTEGPAGSSSPMKLVNPPVALMFHEGAPRLLASGVALPGLHPSTDKRIALEAYPGLLVRKQLGIRDSYKSDTRREHTPARKAARKRIVEAMQAGQPLKIKLVISQTLKNALVVDGSGDLLDAAICAVQAAWASGQPGYGIPRHAPRGEGWIISA